MAERRATRLTFQVHLGYTFDRLRGSKLAQVYELLVPTQQRLVGARVREGVHEVGGDLRSSVLGSAARGTHDCEPDGSADRVREEPRAGGSEGVDLRRRRLYRCDAGAAEP